MHNVSLLRVASVTVALTLVLAACGGGDSATASVASGSDAGNDETVAAGPAMEGVFATVAGGQLDLGATEGQDTVLWFWAPW
jgi:hypothetical protein